MKVVASYLLFPFLLLISSVFALQLTKVGYRPEIVVLIVGTGQFLAIWALENILPYESKWNLKDPERLNDIGHTLFGTYLGGSIGNRLVQVFMLPLGIMIASHFHSSFWPKHIPFFFQVVLVYLVADFGRYWQHRMHHEIPFLWRFHSLHHSANQMNVFKTSRSHIVERILQQLCMYGPLALVGAPNEVILWYILPNSLLGPLDHSNLDVKLGYLEYFMMGPAGHRIHHSLAKEDRDLNYGSALVIWDQIFGTYRFPKKEIRQVGIEGPAFSNHFLRQLLP